MSLKNITINKGMNKNEVNQLIGEYILLEDDTYMGNNYKHNWKCSCGNIIKGRIWSNIQRLNLIKCSECSGRVFSGADMPYIRSIAHHIEVELETSLETYWDFDKNITNAYHIAKGSAKKIWIKCQNKEYHGSYEIEPRHFVKGGRCPYCNTFASKKLHPLDSLGHKMPLIASMIIYDENKLSVDVFNITTHNSKKFYLKCPDCNKISSTPKRLNHITNRGFHCEYCSDGISIPEKFISNLLNQLDINFNTQLSKTAFEWCGRYKYDFYIPSLNMIIETHGEQHYRDNTAFQRSLKEVQENDKFKKELALSNGIRYYIELDCRKSTLEWLKSVAQQGLSRFFDLSNVKWDCIWEMCQTSNILKACELWNQRHTIYEISEKLNIHRSTIPRNSKTRKEKEWRMY